MGQAATYFSICVLSPSLGQPCLQLWEGSGEIPGETRDKEETTFQIKENFTQITASEHNIKRKPSVLEVSSLSLEGRNSRESLCTQVIAESFHRD